MNTLEKVLLGFGGAAILSGGGYLAYKLTSTPEKTDDVKPEKEPIIRTDTKKDVGKLQITVFTEVSGANKFLIGLKYNQSELAAKVKTYFPSIIKLFNKSPSVPHIEGNTGYIKSFKSVDGGYLTVVNFIADFHHGATNGPVRKDALVYITKILKALPTVGSRITKVTAAKVA